MVLGGEDELAHPDLASHAGPLVRIHVGRIEERRGFVPHAPLPVREGVDGEMNEAGHLHLLVPELLRRGHYGHGRQVRWLASASRDEEDDESRREAGQRRGPRERRGGRRGPGVAGLPACAPRLSRCFNKTHGASHA